jgi:hypothetical protein
MPSLKHPPGLVVIPVEWVRNTLDAAVRRGRMTRDDAAELLAELLRGGSDEGDEDGFPIEGYDDLTAAEVAGRVKGLDADQLRRVRDYERRNANRKTVLSVVEQQLPR